MQTGSQRRRSAGAAPNGPTPGEACCSGYYCPRCRIPIASADAPHSKTLPGMRFAKMVGRGDFPLPRRRTIAVGQTRDARRLTRVLSTNSVDARKSRAPVSKTGAIDVRGALRSGASEQKRTARQAQQQGQTGCFDPGLSRWEHEHRHPLTWSHSRHFGARNFFDSRTPSGQMRYDSGATPSRLRDSFGSPVTATLKSNVRAPWRELVQPQEVPCDTCNTSTLPAPRGFRLSDETRGMPSPPRAPKSRFSLETKASTEGQIAEPRQDFQRLGPDGGAMPGAFLRVLPYSFPSTDR